MALAIKFAFYTDSVFNLIFFLNQLNCILLSFKCKALPDSKIFLSFTWFRWQTFLLINFKSQNICVYMSLISAMYLHATAAVDDNRISKENMKWTQTKQGQIRKCENKWLQPKSTSFGPKEYGNYKTKKKNGKVKLFRLLLQTLAARLVLKLWDI